MIDVDNGTRGTIVYADPRGARLEMRADDGRRLRLPRAYVEAGHVEHAYALTAHSLQGATVESACVVSRPDDHSRRWTYTACSRARTTTHHIVINDNTERRETTSRVDAVARLLEAMGRDDDDELATKHVARDLNTIMEGKRPLELPLANPSIRRSRCIDVSGLDLGR